MGTLLAPRREIKGEYDKKLINLKIVRISKAINNDEAATMTRQMQGES